MIISPMMSLGPKQLTQNQPSYYGGLMVHQLLFSSLSFLVVFVGTVVGRAIFPEWGLTRVPLPLAMVVFFQQNQDFLRRFFFLNECHCQAFFNDFISYLGQLAVLIVLFSFDRLTVPMALWSIAATSGIAVFVGILALKKVPFRFDRWSRILRDNWSFSKWMSASAVLQWTSGNLFFLASGSFLGASAVGAMKASQNIMGVTHVFFQAFENMLPAKTSRCLRDGGLQGMNRYLKLITARGTIIMVCLAALVISLAGPILNLVFGVEYQAYSGTLCWYSIIYIFVFLSYPVTMGLRSLEYTFPIFFASFLASAFALASCASIIARFGLHGALGGILMTNLLQVIALYCFFRKHLRKKLEQETKKV
jgi:O-antigen/teichoic acid export membrane protein